MRFSIMSLILLIRSRVFIKKINRDLDKYAFIVLLIDDIE